MFFLDKFGGGSAGECCLEQEVLRTAVTVFDREEQSPGCAGERK